MWEAFFRLSASRPVTMAGSGPIPFEAIDRYADRYRVTDFDELYTLLSAMDSVYLEHAHEEREKDD